MFPVELPGPDPLGGVVADPKVPPEGAPQPVSPPDVVSVVCGPVRVSGPGVIAPPEEPDDPAPEEPESPPAAPEPEPPEPAPEEPESPPEPAPEPDPLPDCAIPAPAINKTSVRVIKTINIFFMILDLLFYF